MKKNLLSTNCFDTEETMVIVGSCVESMFPKAFEKIERLSDNIYEVCLEETHLNMVVTKIIGMVARDTVKKLIFISVDKSPHCVQLHYIVKELENAIDITKLDIENYVVVGEDLINIPLEVISLSKNLSKLKEKLKIWSKENLRENKNEVKKIERK